MPLNLDTPTSFNTSIDSIKITSFAVDLDRKEMYVSYSEMSGSSKVTDKSITIVEPDFSNTIINANTEATVDVYTPLKVALYNQIKAVTLVEGLVE